MAFTIVRNDLAQVEADAIVVPANSRLAITGGTVMAVAKAAGFRRMQRACNRLGGCPTGQAVATPGFRLKASHVIHAVGPVWQGGNSHEPQLLRSAYDNALHLALRLNAQSVAMPLLSTGSFGYPVRPAFEIAIEAIRDFLERADIDVILVVYDRRAVEEGSRLFGAIAEYIDDAQVEASRSFTQRREERSAFDPYEEELVNASSQYDAASTPDYELAAPAASAPFAGSAPSISTESDFWGQTEYASMPPEPAPSASAPSPRLRVPGKKRASEPAPRVPSFGHSKTRDKQVDLGDLLANMDASFSEMLLQLIDARGLTDAQVYKRANITRQHFAKIRKPGYRPTKKTVLALAVALRLSLAETNELLARAGYALSHSNKFDIIVEYFIVSGNYDMFAINESLFAYDQPLLG